MPYTTSPILPSLYVTFSSFYLLFCFFFLINLSVLLDKVLATGEPESPAVLLPQSHYNLSFFLLEVSLISTQMHILFFHFFGETVDSYAQGKALHLSRKWISPGCISLSQSATLTNAGGVFFLFPFFFSFYCWPVFQGPLCVSNQDMGVILADLCIELAHATISIANTRLLDGPREREQLDHCLLTLPSNKYLFKSFHVFHHLILHRNTYYYVTSELKLWAPPMKGHFKHTSSCPNHREKKRDFSKMPITIIQLKNKQESRQLLRERTRWQLIVF